MNIQCFIEKADGSPVFVDFEGVRYVFQPNVHGDAVSYVGNAKHAQRMLMMGPAAYIEYVPPETADPAGNITDENLTTMPMPLGNVQRQQPRPDEPLPDNLTVDEALVAGQGGEPGPGPVVETDQTPVNELTPEQAAQDAANKGAVEGLEVEEVVEVEWAPAAVDAKIKEFKTLSDVNFISFLTANKNRIMNWPIVVRTEVAKKISNKLGGYDPEAEGIEGFRLDDYLGDGDTVNS